MTNLADKLEALEKAATPGPWDVDNEYDDDALYSGGGGCGRGFMNFYIGTEVDGKWCTLLDTVNSDHKLIEEDFDEDRKNSWDAIGHSNTNLIVGLVNNLPTIIRALRERDQAVGALRAAARAAELALFVIRKQGVMPNSSWEKGFEQDMQIARATLASIGEPT